MTLLSVSTTEQDGDTIYQIIKSNVDKLFPEAIVEHAIRTLKGLGLVVPGIEIRLPEEYIEQDIFLGFWKGIYIIVKTKPEYLNIIIPSYRHKKLLYDLTEGLPNRYPTEVETKSVFD